MHYGWEGYNEAIVLYVLALGSPTFAVEGDCYSAWTTTYQWENLYGRELLYAGPLFSHQFSHAWIDLRGLQDPFMREKQSDYFYNSKQATYVQQEYARRNPLGFAGYDANCWGFSAGDGPSDDVPDETNEERRRFGYAARGAPFGLDDGQLTPPPLRRCRSRKRSCCPPCAPCSSGIRRSRPTDDSRAASIRRSRPRMVAPGSRPDISGWIRESS